MSQGKADGKEEQKSQEKAVAAASKSSLASRLVEKKSKDDDDSDEDETDYSDEDETDDFDEGEGFLKKATMMLVERWTNGLCTCYGCSMFDKFHRCRIQVMRMIPVRMRRKLQHLRRCTSGFYSCVNFSNLLLDIAMISM